MFKQWFLETLEKILVQALPLQEIPLLEKTFFLESGCQTPKVRMLLLVSERRTQ